MKLNQFGDNLNESIGSTVQDVELVAASSQDENASAAITKQIGESSNKLKQTGNILELYGKALFTPIF
jgi:DNA-binding transcriptional regulator GbsR (MarR family)